jgi:hypothetical protein
MFGGILTIFPSLVCKTNVKPGGGINSEFRELFFGKNFTNSELSFLARFRHVCARQAGQATPQRPAPVSGRRNNIFKTLMTWIYLYYVL